MHEGSILHERRHILKKYIKKVVNSKKIKIKKLLVKY